MKHEKCRFDTWNWSLLCFQGNTFNLIKWKRCKGRRKGIEGASTGDVEERDGGQRKRQRGDIDEQTEAQKA